MVPKKRNDVNEQRRKLLVKLRRLIATKYPTYLEEERAFCEARDLLLRARDEGLLSRSIERDAVSRMEDVKTARYGLFTVAVYRDGNAMCWRVEVGGDVLISANDPTNDSELAFITARTWLHTSLAASLWELERDTDPEAIDSAAHLSGTSSSTPDGVE